MKSKQSLLILPAAVLVAFVAGGAAQQDSDRADLEIRALMERRIGVLARLVEGTRGLYEDGDESVPFDALADAENDLLDARLQAAANAPERIAIRESQLDLAQKLEEFAQHRRSVGEGSSSDALRATANRLASEIALLQEKQR